MIKTTLVSMVSLCSSILLLTGCHLFPQEQKSSATRLASLDTLLIEDGIAAPMRIVMPDSDGIERYVFRLPRWCFQIPPRRGESIDFSEYFPRLTNYEICVNMLVDDFSGKLPKVFLPNVPVNLSNYELVFRFSQEISHLLENPLVVSFSTNSVSFAKLASFEPEWFRSLLEQERDNFSSNHLDGIEGGNDISPEIHAKRPLPFPKPPPPNCFVRKDGALTPALVVWDGKAMEIEPDIFSRSFERIVGNATFDDDIWVRSHPFWLQSGQEWLKRIPEPYFDAWFHNAADWEGCLNQLISLSHFSSVEWLAHLQFSVIRAGKASIECLALEDNDWVWFTHLESKRKRILFPKGFLYDAFWGSAPFYSLSPSLVRRYAPDFGRWIRQNPVATALRHFAASGCVAGICKN